MIENASEQRTLEAFHLMWRENGACRGCQGSGALASGAAVACDGELGGVARIRGDWIPARGSSESFLRRHAPLTSTLPVER